MQGKKIVERKEQKEYTQENFKNLKKKKRNQEDVYSQNKQS